MTTTASKIRDARVEAAISHWAPRFVANGVPLSDFQEVTSDLERWEEWLPAWSRRAAVHEQLGRDALAVLDAAGARSAAVCGISIGGVTSIWLGQNASHRVSRLVLANTAARIGTSEGWSARMREVRAEGMRRAADLAMPRWFTADFLAKRPDVAARLHAIACACPLESYIAACAALRDTDLRRDLHTIMTPTLVIAGSEDPSTTVADGAWLRDNIPDAEMEVLEAAHLSNVERSVEFSNLLTDFLHS